jgi:DHA3 family macrolide efflux protein-like MFS transporter
VTPWRTFLTIWSGQFGSTLGSYMTHFALTIWLWEQTHQVLPLALLAFWTELPRLVVAPFSGAIADRWHRKTIILLSDTITAISTGILLVLYLAGNLEVWHFYLAGIVSGIFSQLQTFAYTASISTLLPNSLYQRASGMASVLRYSSITIAPALAGMLYPLINFSGILALDLGTFLVAIATVIFLHLPHPQTATNGEINSVKTSLLQEIQVGITYIFTRPHLLSLLLMAALFQFVHDLGKSLYSPMILARSQDNTQALGFVSAAAGLGGILGSIAVSLKPLPQAKNHIFFGSMIGAGLCKTVFGLGQSLGVWLPTQFASSLNFPVMGSAKQAILWTDVKPELQGRVFAIASLLAGIASPIAKPLAGWLADRFLEPAMMSDSLLSGLLGNIFGTTPGAGMAVLYTLSSLGLVAVGLSGFWSQPQRVRKP